MLTPICPWGMGKTKIKLPLPLWERAGERGSEKARRVEPQGWGEIRISYFAHG